MAHRYRNTEYTLVCDSYRSAYLDKEVFHVHQWAVEGSQEFGLLKRAVRFIGQWFVALEHLGGVTPTNLL